MKINWKWGAATAIIITLLGLYPQIRLWIEKGSEWGGSYVLIQADETAYSAYINALINKRPRRNDPYAGRNDSQSNPLAETLFSIQFIPAYTIAFFAHLINCSSSTVFIFLLIISATTSSLAIFWLLALLTNDSRVAASGTLFVLCFGTLLAGQGQIRVYLDSPLLYDFFPFLRRYQPSATFPLFFILCSSIWKALNTTRHLTRHIWAMIAGLCFFILVFSYFYLWTAAAAWLACFFIILLITNSHSWVLYSHVFGIIMLIALTALIPYFLLVSNSSKQIYSVTLLLTTHQPDVLRPSVIIGFILIIVVYFTCRQKLISWHDPTICFVASLSSMPTIVFNQQIVTGRYLQPVHYQLFIANYTTLVALFLLTVKILRACLHLKKFYNNLLLIILALASINWGILESVGAERRNKALSLQRDKTILPLTGLAEISTNEFNQLTQPRSKEYVVFASDVYMTENVPTITSEPVLWAYHLYSFSSLSKAEIKERFYQYIYYSGVDGNKLADSIAKGRLGVLIELFGIERAIPELVPNAEPITFGEANIEVNRYVDYIDSFDKERASHPLLSYVIIPSENPPDLSNLDRWYERDAGKKVGTFTIYRVKLKP